MAKQPTGFEAKYLQLLYRHTHQVKDVLAIVELLRQDRDVDTACNAIEWLLKAPELTQEEKANG